MSDHGCTALIVEIPEAEAVVGPHRRRLDSSAALGVPAHVTVLYPFAPATRVDDPLLDTLTALFARCPAFDYRFARTDWFGDEVLWLAPEDPAPFAVVSDAAWAAFPQYPPYGGEFDEVVHHLTVADCGEPGAMRAAEADVVPRLPVSGRAAAVTMLRRRAAGERWERLTRFALADGQTA